VAAANGAKTAVRSEAHIKRLERAMVKKANRVGEVRDWLNITSLNHHVTKLMVTL
jgi:hypothetical protein